MRILTILTIIAGLFGRNLAFVPSTKNAFILDKDTCYSTSQRIAADRSVNQRKPVSLQKQQRYSMAQIQIMSLFGLGGPELAVILVAAAFLLGPQKLAELGKDAGKMAGELKEVPKEFQKGLEEGEAEAMATKKKLTENAEDAEISN